MQISTPLAEALRRNRCKERRQRMLQELAAALERTCEDFAVEDFEKTDRIWESYQKARIAVNEGTLPCLAFVYEDEQLSDIENALHKLLNVPDEILYLFRSLSWDCGAIIMHSHAIIQNAFRLIELDGEDIVAVSEDGLCYIGLSYTLDPTPIGYRPVYYLSVMGQAFVEALQS